MKKIININFHGRVVPIEETAYDILKQYIESLRVHFAREEGRDEIVNDIENRFAELFSERIKKGSACITDADVEAIISSMGRPEDLETEEVAGAQPSSSSGTGPSSSSATSSGAGASSQTYSAEPRNLYRSENDKILGGVCAGLASYLKIDPAIVRIVFALITFGGFGLGILLYFILWIVLPSKSMAANVRRRLYRNPDNRVIAGVASGLAAYFHIEVWIPRLIFSLPLLAGLLTSIFRHAFHDYFDGPLFITGGFGGSLFLTYIVLWIVLPEATTASEKLEMRGEKIDLESIKNTIKSDLEGVKERAAQMGTEMKNTAAQWSSQFQQGAQQFSQEAGPVVRKTGSGLGHAIGVLFKAFFLFIGGVIAFALITALVGLMFTGAGFFPFSKFFLSGFWQYFLGWGTLVLFLIVPIVALLVWLIRRMFGVHSQRHYLGYVFGSLWTLGWICLVFFIAGVVNNFRTRSSVTDAFAVVNPAHGKLLVTVGEDRFNYDGSDWFGINFEEHRPFYSVNEDSIMMKTIRVQVVKSPDSAYHIQRVRYSHGHDPSQARNLAGQIDFDIVQRDSLILLPDAFAINPEQKFRNQQVLVIVAVPVGKRIEISHRTDDYHWFDINISGRHNIRISDAHNYNYYRSPDEDSWNDYNPVETDVEYIMTEHGLERSDFRVNDEPKKGMEEPPHNSNGYRYRGPGDSSKHSGTHAASPASYSQDDSDEDSDNTDGAFQKARSLPSAPADPGQAVSEARRAFAPILTLFTP